MAARIPSLLLVALMLLAGCAGGANQLSPSATESTTITSTSTVTPTSTANTFQHVIIWAEEDITLTVRFTASESNKTVYNETHSIGAGEELEFTDQFERQPYRISLAMNEETVLQEALGTCNFLRMSVDADGNATVTDRGAGDC